MTYQIINIRTKQIVKTCTTRQAARRYADKKDLEYGAINYTIKSIMDTIDYGILYSLVAPLVENK